MAGNALLSLLVKLGLDTKDFDEGLDRSENNAKALGNNLSKIGGGLVKGGLFAAAAGVGALGGLIASSIGPASDLAETANKVNVIFGEGAGQINDFAKGAATGLGQSQQQALDAASTFGVFGKAADLSGNNLVDFSTSLTGLAGDLASFYNTSPEEAIQSLGAALRGESEPIRKYGVLLDDASLRQKALEMGIIKTTKNALTPQQRVLAAYATIMDQTKDAQGDFVRTSDGLANSQRIIAAQFANMKTQIGTAVLPLIQKLAGALSGLFSDPRFVAGLQTFIAGLAGLTASLITAIPSVVGFFQGVFGWLVENQGVIVAVFAALAVAIVAWAATTIKAALPAAGALIAALWPVILVMAAVGAAAYLLYTAWTQNWGGIQQTAATVWAWLSGVFQQIVAWLQVNIPAAIAWLSTLWSTVLLPAIQAVWTWIQTNLFPLFSALATLFTTVWGVAITVFAALWTNVLAPALQKAWDWLGPKLLPIFKDLGSVVQDVAKWVGGALTDAFNWVTKAIQDVTGWIQELAKQLQNIHLPDWMVPGSPTPWEIGLRGIADALDDVSKASLPKLEAALDLSTPPGVAKAGAGGGNVNQTINYNIFASETPGQVAQGLSLAALMGGAE